VSAEGHHSPLDQFAVSPVFELPKLFGIDASITNSSAVMIASVLLVLIVFAYAMRRRAVVPGRMQSLAELSYMFVRDTVGENAGHAGLRYAPFIFTLFLFILAMNLLGLVPKSFAPTSHIIITFGMGAFVFLGITLVGLIKKGPIGFFKHFIPSGIPLFIAPMIFLIELVSYMARPISLGLRLAANMIAGHTLIHVIAGFVAPLAALGGALGIIAAAFPVLFLVFMTGLEVFVAILQAYIFALLCSMYLGEALADDHH
jgi:F-type H+-transporting ATPase subunit a